MYNIQAVCTLQELWNCCASLFVNYYRFDNISVNLMFYLWLSLKMHFICGRAFWKLLLTNENISKHSARQSKLPLNILLENSVFSAWILLEYSLNFMSKNQNGLCINIFCYPKLLGLLVNTYEYENFKKDASTVNCFCLHETVLGTRLPCFITLIKVSILSLSIFVSKSDEMRAYLAFFARHLLN